MRVGYTFNGWVSDGTIYNYSTPWNIADDTTLTASWILSVYAITLDTDGGILNSNVASTCTYFDTIELPSATKYGYNFGGWETSTGAAVSSISNTTTNVDLIARWYQTIATISDSGTYIINQDGVVYLDLYNLSATKVCVYSIASNVNELYVRAREGRFYTMQRFIVETRTTDLTISLEDANFSAGTTVLDASGCTNLTINLVGDNNRFVHVCGYMDIDDANESGTIKCQNVTFVGDSMTLVGGIGLTHSENDYYAANGTPGISVSGNMIVSCDSLDITGGMGRVSYWERVYFNENEFISEFSAGKGGTGVFFTSSGATLTIATNSNLVVHGGKGGNVSVYSEFSMVHQTGGLGGFAIANAFVIGQKNTDLFVGGNGGDVDTTILCYPGSDYAMPGFGAAGTFCCSNVLHETVGNDGIYIYETV